MGGQNLAAAQMIVEEQAQPQDGPGPQALVVRQHEAQRPDDVRRGIQQHLALDQRLAHQAELIMLEIAQAAVDELGRGLDVPEARSPCSARKHLQAAPRCIARDAAAIDAAADDEEVIGHSAASICIVVSGQSIGDLEFHAVVAAIGDDGLGRRPVRDEDVDLDEMRRCAPVPFG